jgi:putative tryptophan/tyrosine transport system substrate-binding protein
MAIHIRRREFIFALGGAGIAWPFAARAQQPAMPVVGYLSSRSPQDAEHLVAAFRRGLRQTGYVEGTNITIEYRWADGQYDRLQGLATDLVRREVAVICASSLNAALVAKSASATIPIIFTISGDPVTAGLVSSISRPEGNVTGFTLLSGTLFAKRLELLRELLPAPARIAVLVNPDNRNAETRLSDVQEAARAVGQQIDIVSASGDSDFAMAFADAARQRAAALLVSDDPYFSNRRELLAALTARHALPAIYSSREYAEAGGLMSYGTNYADVQRQAGLYAGQILKGAKPADLPVMLPMKFELVVNLRTARALGLEVPATLLARADEVIE